MKSTSAPLCATFLTVALVAPAFPQQRETESDAALLSIARRRDRLLAEWHGAFAGENAGRQSPTPSTDRVASLATHETTLLVYTFDDDRSRLAVIHPSVATGTSWHDLELRPNQLAEKVDEVLRHLRSRSRISRGQLTRLGDELGDVLLAPAVAAIRNSKNVTIFAEPPLLGLPFAMLRSPRRLDSSREPLIATVGLCSTLSLAGSTGDSHVNGFAKNTTAVAMADPEYRPVALPLGASLSDHGVSWRERAARRNEAYRVTVAFPATSVLVGEQVTREALLSVPRDTDILHLALPMERSRASPARGALLLSPTTPGPPDRLDLQVLARELSVDVELVVLSGYDSSFDTTPPDWGALPAAVAFDEAGTRQSVLSLWPVLGESNGVLFEHFYQGLLNGDSVSESLRSAQLKLYRSPIEIGTDDRSLKLDATDPYYWAGFQVYGGCR